MLIFKIVALQFVDVSEEENVNCTMKVRLMQFQKVVKMLLSLGNTFQGKDMKVLLIVIDTKPCKFQWKYFCTVKMKTTNIICMATCTIGCILAWTPDKKTRSNRVPDMMRLSPNI